VYTEPLNEMCGQRQCSRYTDSIRAGRSGGRIPVQARFSVPVQTGPGDYPVSCTMDTGTVSWGAKRTGCGFDYPLQYSAEVKTRVELYLYSPSGPSLTVLS
jgi:hypothetical protein